MGASAMFAGTKNLWIRLRGGWSMNLDDVGVPPLAFVQMLESQALDPDAVAQLRNIMAREGTRRR